MTVSVFDLFSIGIEPPSSHTVGPMRAAHTFAAGLAADGLLDQVLRVKAELFGSLGATGHGSASAVILGLQGERAETVDTQLAPALVSEVRGAGRLLLAGRRDIRFTERDDLVLHRRRSLPEHPNGIVRRGSSV